MIKVIHVAHEAELYGISTYLLNLLRHQKRNHDLLHIAVAFHEEGPKIEQFKELGLPVYALRKRSARDIRLLFLFYNIFRKYDLINLHTFSPLAFFAALLTRKKIIYTFHGTLGLRYFYKIPLTTLYMKFIFVRGCDFFTFASEYALQKFLKGYGNIKMDKSKFAVFPYGIDTSKIKQISSRDLIRKELGVENKFIIGSVACLKPSKRIEQAITALNQLRLKSACLLLIIGSGHPSYENTLKKLAIKYKLEQNVKFLGFRNDAVEIMKAFDLFVFPVHKEAFGLALLEAMALGIPSIVFQDAGGPIDIIGDSGIVVKNVEELAEKIEELYKNPLLRKTIAAKCKNRASDFDISKTAKRLLSIYEEIMLN